jgi:hypothetical protein
VPTVMVAVAYRGPWALATALTTLLTNEGLTVSWDPAQEQRTGAYANEVLIQMLVTVGPKRVPVERAAKTAVNKFTDRFPGVEATIESTAIT